MPFTQLTPRPFTSAVVHMYAPLSSGLYGISNAREWIYIGETDDIQGALLAHLSDLQAWIMRQSPTGFVFEVCERGKRSGRQDRLVFEYEPSGNRHAARKV